MTLLDSLIIGWSIVWTGALILTGTMINNTQMVLIMWGAGSGVNSRAAFLFSLAIYSFGVWAIGCIILYLVVFL